MRHPPSTRRRWLAAWKTWSNRPASGRSFVVIIVLGTLAAVAVTIWTFWSTSPGSGASSASGGFRI